MARKKASPAIHPTEGEARALVAAFEYVSRVHGGPNPWHADVARAFQARLSGSINSAQMSAAGEAARRSGAPMLSRLAWADRTHHDEVERVRWADFGSLSAIASIAGVVDERNALRAALAERFAVEEEQRKALNDPSMDAGAVGARDMRSRLVCQGLLGEKTG